jgi:hypothetical protein
MGVVHFWRQGALNAQGGALEILVGRSPIGDYDMSR